MLGKDEDLLMVCKLDKQGEPEVDGTLSVAERIKEIVPTQRYVIIHEQSAGASTAAYFGCTSRAFGTAIKPDRYMRWSDLPGGIRMCLSTLRRTKIISEAFEWSGTEWPGRNLGRRFSKLLSAGRNRGGIGSAVYTPSTVLRREVTTTLLIECADPALSTTHALIVSATALSLHYRFILDRDVAARSDQSPSNSDAAFTAKEREVFEWISRGKTSWEAAQILATSERTVKFHLSNIYAKLNVSNRAQAINVAGRRGLLNWAPGIRAET